MGATEPFLKLLLCLGLCGGVLTSLCGEYQRKFCLKTLIVYLGRGGGTYSGMAKLGESTVDRLCGYFYNDTVPCLKSMRPHCLPVEEAELQGEIDLHQYVCKAGRKDLMETSQCLSGVEANTADCTAEFRAGRQDTQSRLDQRKIDQETARQETCQHIATLSSCAYGKATKCGVQRAKWMQSIFDTKMGALRVHLECSAASGLISVPVGLLTAWSWLVVSRLLQNY